MLDKKEPFYQLSVCKDFLDLKEVWLGSVDSAIGSAKVLAVSARHSSGSRLVISMAVPVKRRTLWLVERRWVTPAPSSCWKVVKRLLQEIKHTNKHLKKNVDVLRSFGRTFSTFLVYSLLFLVSPLFPRNLELPDLSFSFPSHGWIPLFILSFNLGFPELSPRFSIFMAWNIKYFCHHPKRVWRFIKPEGKTEGGGGRRLNKVRARGHHQYYG